MANPVIHGTVIEIVWTIVPSLILVVVALPSFALLYSIDEVIDPSLTIKCTGHQWYWSYEYSDSSEEIGALNFDSYMVPEDELELGELRLLEVDNRIVLPMGTHVRVLVTAADVLHSWAVPSLGIKVDACVGRLNETSMFALREGVFYGQCSEICWRLDRTIWGIPDEFTRIPGSLNILFDVIMYELRVGLKRTLIKMIIAWTSLNGDLWKTEMLKVIFKLQLSINVSQIALIEWTNRKNDWRSTNNMRVRENVIRNDYWLPDRSKLGNLVKFYYIQQVSRIKREVIISNDKLLMYGGKIVTKSFNKNKTPNLHAKKYGVSRSFSSLANTTTEKYHIKNAKDIFETGKQIKAELTAGKWVDVKLKKKIAEIVFNIQKDIARDTISLKSPDDQNEGIKLTKEWAHKLILHVHVVEELSKRKGSNIPGLDGLTLERSSTPEEKIKLVKQLKRWKSSLIEPVRQVWIPKNKDEKRCLGIPNLIDRGTQLMWVILLDPIVENSSDPHSFGFRKGRNAAQAIGHIQKNLQSIRDDSMYIWDADIRKCFLCIDHSWIMNNIPIPSEWKEKLWGWLKSGNVTISTNGDKTVFEEWHIGVPQGGILFPLLMNVLLNGIEELINETLINAGTRSRKILLRKKATRITIGAKYTEIKDVGKIRYRHKVIGFFYCRYVDDFIIGCCSRHILKKIQKEVIKFLDLRGLVIDNLKSRTIHFKEKTSFDFLGYTFIRLRYSPYKRVKYLQFTVPEYGLEPKPRLYIHPSKKNFREICRKFKILIRQNYNISAFQLINKINPLVQGWCNYFFLCNSTGTRNSLRFRMWLDLKKWTIRKHPKAGRTWLMKQYFLISDLHQTHELSDSTLKAIKDKLKCYNLNTWTFYGLACKNRQGQKYKVPKVNWVYFPSDNVKTIVASSLVPNMTLLIENFYLNKEKWQKERNKRDKVLINNTLGDKLYQRNKDMCYFCNQDLKDE